MASAGNRGGAQRSSGDKVTVRPAEDVVINNPYDRDVPETVDEAIIQLWTQPKTVLDIQVLPQLTANTPVVVLSTRIPNYLIEYKAYLNTGEEIQLGFNRLSATSVEVTSLVTLNNVQIHLTGE